MQKHKPHESTHTKKLWFPMTQQQQLQTSPDMTMMTLRIMYARYMHFGLKLNCWTGMWPRITPTRKPRASSCSLGERVKTRGNENERVPKHFFLVSFTSTHKHAHRERQRDRETETERQRQRETERQRDRETERQRDRHTHTHTHTRLKNPLTSFDFALVYTRRTILIRAPR